MSLLKRSAIDAYRQVPFYRKLYDELAFDPGKLDSWDAWQQTPILTKSRLQQVPVNERIRLRQSGFLAHTGGTSGEPLEFMLDRHTFAKEWAHLHHIWKSHGYCPRDLKLTFRGRYFDPKTVIRYNAVHNELIVNAITPMDQVIDAVKRLRRVSAIKWVHGFPSVVSDFASALTHCDAGFHSEFRAGLSGVLLGSELPTPYYRSNITDNLSSNIASWYGHSEMAVLAYEVSPGVYQTLPTYGFAEAVKCAQTGYDRLVCTSIYNAIHPFIRYDTGDLIQQEQSENGSLRFRVSEGRIGDFIHDQNGQRHSLTSVILGRHHNIQKHLRHIQVREDGPGKITFLLTPRVPATDLTKIAHPFDMTGLKFDWRIEAIREPLRTRSGKIRLKVMTPELKSTVNT